MEGALCRLSSDTIVYVGGVAGKKMPRDKGFCWLPFLREIQKGQCRTNRAMSSFGIQEKRLRTYYMHRVNIYRAGRSHLIATYQC